MLCPHLCLTIYCIQSFLLTFHSRIILTHNYKTVIYILLELCQYAYSYQLITENDAQVHTLRIILLYQFVSSLK